MGFHHDFRHVTKLPAKSDEILAPFAAQLAALSAKARRLRNRPTVLGSGRADDDVPAISGPQGAHKVALRLESFPQSSHLPAVVGWRQTSATRLMMDTLEIPCPITNTTSVGANQRELPEFRICIGIISE
jgi:hypothetical protein